MKRNRDGISIISLFLHVIELYFDFQVTQMYDDETRNAEKSNHVDRPSPRSRKFANEFYGPARRKKFLLPDRREREIKEL